MLQELLPRAVGLDATLYALAAVLHFARWRLMAALIAWQPSAAMILRETMR
jgi:hypothetical protein